MNMTNFGSYDKDALEKNYNQALNDSDFKKVVEDLHLNDDVLMKYTSKLQEAVNEYKNCSSCKGILMCQNKLKGYLITPEKQGKHLRFDNVACKYMEKIIRDEETSCHYYEMPEALKKASMREIDISDKKRVNAIKWLKSFYDTYFTNPNQKGLYLTGSFGSGKTYLTCAMLNELSKKGVDITIVYYPELLRSLKESFENGDFSSRINKLKKTSILFLDDIGAESVTPWARDEILGTILQYRMDSSLPTFFTSNLNIGELEDHLASTKGNIDKVKARRIIERIKQLTEQIELISVNRRK